LTSYLFVNGNVVSVSRVVSILDFDLEEEVLVEETLEDRFGDYCAVELIHG
jgi:hypothetical protein